MLPQHPIAVGIYVLAAILALYGLFWLLNAVIAALTLPGFSIAVLVGLAGFLWFRFRR